MAMVIDSTRLLTYSATLRRTASCVAEARGIVRVALAAWGLDELAEDGALVVSELVATPYGTRAAGMSGWPSSAPGPAPYGSA